jgi:hypothetical protein
VTGIRHRMPTRLHAVVFVGESRALGSDSGGPSDRVVQI